MGAGLGPLGPQNLNMGVKEGRKDTYFPAVQTASKGEGTARGAMQPHVVSLQDKVMQLQAMQCLGLGHVQATHEAASTNVNGALAGERKGILSEQHRPRYPQHIKDLTPATLPTLCPTLRPHLKVAVLQDTPRIQSDRAF